RGENLRLEATILHSDVASVDLHHYFEAFAQLADTLYVGAFRNAINVGTKQDYFDIQIGQAFIQRWQAFQSGPNKENDQAIIRLVNEVREIFGFAKLEILPADDGQTLHLNVNDTPRKLHEVGSGLAQLVVVLANAATRRPAYVLIDEPE